jgi:dephospho-CoA kinase
MKLLIGIVGAPLAGKETIANTLETLLTSDGYSAHRQTFSKILRDTLDLWGIDHGRENEQKIAMIMNAETGFKDGALSRAMQYRLAGDSADVNILDGVRWLPDEAMIRLFTEHGVKNIIVYVDASADVRYQRLIVRNRAGEAQTTREAFDKQEKVLTEINIAAIGSRAEIKLVNNYTNVDDFRKDIEKAYREKIKPMLG